MSKYTTGEIAKLTGVTVRTVQYYDARGILVPSQLSEGGRRLYSEDDLRKMHIICFLRDIGVSINDIGRLFSEDNSEKIISMVLGEQQKALMAQKRECESRLSMIESIRREIKDKESFSVESIADIAYAVKNKDKLRKMRWFMILTGIPVAALQWVALVLGLTKGFWWMFAIWGAVAIPWGVAVSIYYFRKTAYICPECHEVFKPKFKSAFFAYHTPTMRRLTCPCCNRKGLCVEVYQEEEKMNND